MGSAVRAGKFRSPSTASTHIVVEVAREWHDPHTRSSGPRGCCIGCALDLLFTAGGAARHSSGCAYSLAGGFSTGAPTRTGHRCGRAKMRVGKIVFGVV